jgi:hypothetical protein
LIMKYAQRKDIDLSRLRSCRHSEKCPEPVAKKSLTELTEL